MDDFSFCLTYLLDSWMRAMAMRILVRKKMRVSRRIPSTMHKIITEEQNNKSHKKEQAHTQLLHTTIIHTDISPRVLPVTLLVMYFICSDLLTCLALNFYIPMYLTHVCVCVYTCFVYFTVCNYCRINCGLWPRHTKEFIF